MYPGERVMREAASSATHSTSWCLRLTPAPDWCEQTHLGRDMSGLELQQTTSPRSGEQCNFGFSPEHNENDFCYLNTEDPSSQANNLGLQDTYFDNVLEDDSIMFDNSTYSDFQDEMNTFCPPLSETTDFMQTPTTVRSRDLLLHTCTESSFSSPPEIKEEKKSSIARPRYLAIFDSEEPLIKEEPGLFSTGSGECEMKYELEVAAEEEVVTEEVLSSPQSLGGPMLDPDWFDSSTPYCKVEPKEEPEEEPLSPASAMDNSDYLLEDMPSLSQELNIDWSAESALSSSASQLRLDIGAAVLGNTQLLGESLVDTPEVLKPVLKPLGDFDLINFLLANSDSNNNSNNSVLPTVPVETSKKPLRNALLERRRGKSMQALLASKLAQSDNETPSTSDAPDPLVQRLTFESLQSPASSTSSRPRRESASRFNQRLEEGLLQDVTAVSSDDEEFCPLNKRIRTTSSSSSSSRIHHNSRGNVSPVTYMLYRERRDRNNVSSKLSRQKRKMAQQMKVQELKELEKKNLRLKKKEHHLSTVLDTVLHCVKGIPC